MHKRLSRNHQRLSGTGSYGTPQRPRRRTPSAPSQPRLGQPGTDGFLDGERLSGRILWVSDLSGRSIAVRGGLHLLFRREDCLVPVHLLRKGMQVACEIWFEPSGPTARNVRQVASSRKKTNDARRKK